MPTPRQDESNWMSRCIPYVINEGRSQDQAVAICASIWRNRNKKDYLSEKERKEDLIFGDKET